MATVRKSRIGTHHVFSACRNCGKTWDDYLKAAAQGRAHAAATGHTGIVERGQTWTYNPKKNS